MHRLSALMNRVEAHLHVNEFNIKEKHKGKHNHCVEVHRVWTAEDDTQPTITEISMDNKELKIEHTTNKKQDPIVLPLSTVSHFSIKYNKSVGCVDDTGKLREGKIRAREKRHFEGEDHLPHRNRVDPVAELVEEFSYWDWPANGPDHAVDRAELHNTSTTKLKVHTTDGKTVELFEDSHSWDSVYIREKNDSGEWAWKMPGYEARKMFSSSSSDESPERKTKEALTDFLQQVRGK
eukprot:TRINITY_DN66457_c11_g1_i1.p1 TRINITY_DN66457_c11_g1~~TRINITY_DN66457_c11_g1_i1.p1  ORF type:complete len:236 (+),score=15.22 TRINITY_DN66457_c11_g1_i1:34-741(+)